MNSINPSAAINQCELDSDKVSSIHYESEQKPYDTAITTFTDTQPHARVTCPESIIQETAWNPFKEIRTVINQYAPRFA